VRLAQSPRELSSPVSHIRCAELAQLWLNPVMSYVYPSGERPPWGRPVGRRCSESREPPGRHVGSMRESIARCTAHPPPCCREALTRALTTLGLTAGHTAPLGLREVLARVGDRRLRAGTGAWYGSCSCSVVYRGDAPPACPYAGGPTSGRPPCPCLGRTAGGEARGVASRARASGTPKY
jgi:hypothetical protein